MSRVFAQNSPLQLYAQEILSFGKASEIAGLNRFGFAELVTHRNIPRHYTEEEFSQDLDYGKYLNLRLPTD